MRTVAKMISGLTMLPGVLLLAAAILGIPCLAVTAGISLMGFPILQTGEFFRVGIFIIGACLAGFGLLVISVVFKPSPAGEYRTK